MSRRRLVLVVVVIVGLAGAGFALRALNRPPADDEQQLLALVTEAAQAAERREVKALRALVAEDYRDERGRDRAAINQLLSLYFLRRGVVSVYVVDRSVDIGAETVVHSARVRVKAVLTRGAKVDRLSDIVPEAARALSFDLTLKKTDDGWRVTAASWRSLRNVEDLLR